MCSFAADRFRFPFPFPFPAMSEAALEKIQLERDSLAKELQLVQSAIPKDKAAEALITYMADKTDPFNAPDNEWASASETGPCCTVA